MRRLTSLLTIVQLYPGIDIYWWRKLEYHISNLHFLLPRLLYVATYIFHFVYLNMVTPLVSSTFSLITDLFWYSYGFVPPPILPYFFLLKLIKESYGSENYLALTYGNNVLCNATYNYFIGVNTFSINNINIILNI